jgi:neuraminyllactose-binding hemagglutinin
MKKILLVIKLTLVGTVLSIGFSGCGTKIAVKKEIGQLNFKYQIKNQKPRVNKKIAIVSPTFSKVKIRRIKEIRNPFTGEILNIGSRNINFNRLFNNSYRDRLAKSMSLGFEDLMSKKGFIIGGKYETFDDMTYPERKSTYMALTPIININIDKKPTEQKRHRLYYSEKGEIQVSGELIIKMIEPLSKQMFISKRINLSDFNIRKPYIHEAQFKSKTSRGFGVGSMISGTIDKASAPSSLRDNTDKVLTEALNEFYQKAMPKIEKYISQEEILSLEKDVNSAKGKTGGSW